MTRNLLIPPAEAFSRSIRPMVRWYKVPAWVRNFPYDADRAGLIQLALSTRGPLDTPREMVFVISGLRGKQAVENAVFTIEQEGWRSTVRPQHGMPGKCIIESRKIDYELTEEHYMYDCAFFNRVARLYSAESDGWYAGGKPLRKSPAGRHHLQAFKTMAAAVKLRA